MAKAKIDENEQLRFYGGLVDVIDKVSRVEQTLVQMHKGVLNSIEKLEHDQISRHIDVSDRLKRQFNVIMDTFNNLLQTVQLNKTPPARPNNWKAFEAMQADFNARADKQADPYAKIVKEIFGDTTVSVAVARDMNKLEERMGSLYKALEEHRRKMHESLHVVYERAAETNERIRRQANALDSLTTRVIALETKPRKRAPKK